MTQTNEILPAAITAAVRRLLEELWNAVLWPLTLSLFRLMNSCCFTEACGNTMTFCCDGREDNSVPVPVIILPALCSALPTLCWSLLQLHLTQHFLFWCPGQREVKIPTNTLSPSLWWSPLLTGIPGENSESCLVILFSLQAFCPSCCPGADLGSGLPRANVPRALQGLRQSCWLSFAAVLERRRTQVKFKCHKSLRKEGIDIYHIL